MAKIYGHSNFAGPREELKRALENPTRGRFIFVIGPSGGVCVHECIRIDVAPA